MLKQLCQGTNLSKLLVETLIIVKTLSIVILVLSLILKYFWQNNLSNYTPLLGDIYEKIIVVASYITNILFG
jgi:hypothetical protein